MDFIIRVWRGEAGLARTYWLFGGLLSVPLWIWIGSVTPGTGAAVIAGAALGAYLTWVNVGVWRASAQYDGRPIFASLARAAAALGFLLAVGVSGGVLYAVATGSWKNPPIDWEKGVYAPPPSSSH
jgi:hypothetical protein